MENTKEWKKLHNNLQKETYKDPGGREETVAWC